MCTVFTASDMWRHARKIWYGIRETMGALCCWLPSSLQIGRLRGDRVGWREVCVCVCARTRVCAVARIQWMDLKGERRENSGSERLSPTNKAFLLGRHSEQCVTWAVTPSARQRPGRQNDPSPTKGMRLYLAKHHRYRQTRVAFNHPLCILSSEEKKL